MTDALRLSDILARNLPLEWFEAIALVSETAEHVRDSLGGRNVPELDQVELSANGQLVLTGAARTNEPVRRLGQLLQASLGQTDPPVQLRLVVAQATAPEAAYPSIKEFSDALAYFERPDRGAILRELYQRAQAVPSPAVGVTPTLDLIAPLPPVDEAKREPASKGRGRASRRELLVVSAMLLILLSAAAYWRTDASTDVKREVVDLTVKATDVVGTTLVKGISVVSEGVGLGRLAPAEGSSTSPQAVRLGRKPTPKGTRSQHGAQTEAEPSFRVFDVDLGARGLGTQAPPGSFGVPADRPALPTLATSQVNDGIVYSADDPSVSPPIGIRPQLPRVLPEEIRRDRLSQIELIILPDGTVGSAKLIGAPHSVIEGMLLSAAKAWKFSPAQKDGRPVGYRKIVWLAQE